jgi:hypothetical protein
LSAELQVPRSVEEVTPRWLTQALSVRHPGTTVRSIRDKNVLWGTATKVLLEVEYENDPGPNGPGTRLCVKGELDERVRASMSEWSATPTQIEVAFYNDLAPRLDVPLSPVYFGLAEHGVGGVLIMDDLNEQGVTFGDARKPWSVDEVAGGLEALALLHGGTWGRDFSDIPFLQVGSPTVRSAVEALFSEQSWEHTFAGDTPPPWPEALGGRDRILRAYHASYALDDAAAHSVVHGDAHLGNAFLSRDGRALFLDWAGPCRAPWSFDVGYFITGALTVEDRRASARELVTHYLKALASVGGPELDADEAWDDFRRHQLHGAIWTMLPSTMQPTESVHAMTERYASAIDDYDTFEALGV